MTTNTTQKVIRTDRDAFEVIREHLLSQADRSIGVGSVCMYRGYKNEFIEDHYPKYQKQEKPSPVSILDGMFKFFQWIEDNNIAAPDDKAKCAVGVLIKDEFYGRGMETKAVDYDSVSIAIDKSHPEWNYKNSISAFSLLKKMQEIHDHAPVDDWYEILMDERNWVFTLDNKFVEFKHYDVTYQSI